jgi:Domain of unknown function (DUF5060)
MLTPLLTFGQVLDAPGGRTVLERHLPGAMAAPVAKLRPIMLSLFLRVTPSLRDDPKAQERFWTEVDEVMGPVLFPEHVEHLAAAAPNPMVTRASAPWELVNEPTRWGLLEVALRGPFDGNPFVDVELSAEFRCGSRTWTVGGFYDGDGVYRLRALAEEEGVWQFVTTSTAPALPLQLRGRNAVPALGYDRVRLEPSGGPAAGGHPPDPGLLTVHEAADVPVSQALRVQHR